MVPKVAVECSAIEHLVRNHGVDRLVALERLAVGVQPKEKIRAQSPSSAAIGRTLFSLTFS